MKKILLSLVVVATGFGAQSQVLCSGVSPASIQGNYPFTWADPGGGDWSTPDFNIPATFVEDTLMLVEDGEPGTNPQGNPVSQEGCNPLINDLTGKIAVIYRNTCEFGLKALNAENAGAVGVLIVNREDALVNMGGGVEGLNVTIPVGFVSNVTGATLINEMNNGPVVLFMGNKLGLYTDDAGSASGDLLVSPFAGAHDAFFDGFSLGIQVYNWGTNSQSNLTVTANIDHATSGNVYNEVVTAPTMNTGDTVSIFDGNTFSFTPFTMSTYPAGEYTLTYTIDLGVADGDPVDNTFTSTFTLNSDIISLARLDGSGMPISNLYPSNTDGEYQSCMVVNEAANAGNIGVQGLYFFPYTDTSVNQLAGAEIIVNVYNWDDAWVDLTDPVGATDYGLFFQSLNSIVYETHYPASNSENGQMVYVPFSNPFVITPGQRYLICLQTFDPVIAFGYDNGPDYDGNYGIYAQPISPVLVTTNGVPQWYSGWSGTSAPSIGLKTADNIGINEVNTVDGMAYPNPAKDVVTISLEANGNASLTITDISGKIASSSSLSLVDGKSNVDIASLDAGVYIFNVTLENGQTSQFNVVKK